MKIHSPKGKFIYNYKGKNLNKNSMKHIFKFLWIFMIEALKSAFWACLLSGVFWVFKWLGSLMSITDSPRLGHFLGGAIGIFAFLFIYKMFWMIRDTRRRLKNSEYDFMANTIGLTWKEYKEYVKGKNGDNTDKT